MPQLGLCHFLNMTSKITAGLHTCISVLSLTEMSDKCKASLQFSFTSSVFCLYSEVSIVR